MISISEIDAGSIVFITRPYKSANPGSLVVVDQELYELIQVDPGIVNPVPFSKDLIENVLKLKPETAVPGKVYQLFVQFRLLLNEGNTVEFQEYAEFILRLKQNIKYLHELQREFYLETKQNFTSLFNIAVHF